MTPTRRSIDLAAAAWLLLAVTGCSVAPVSPRGPGDGDTTTALPRLSPEQAADVTLQAVSLVGTPYRYGGNTPESGFDCSGLIAFVYRHSAGIAAPRTVASLVHWGQPVPAASARTGDLVVFSRSGGATHAGIYVGEGRFVHAPSTGGEVRLDRLTSAYWSKQPSTFRRP